MGGEKELDDRFKTAELGSPPRRRGKVHSQLLVVGIVRITPAWAGKSTTVTCSRLPRWDHPRMGGEKPDVAAHVRAKLGSPPRRRGKEVCQPFAGKVSGITPTWAGKSYIPSASAYFGGDHPRVGGEKILAALMPENRLGSPPRGRGKAGQDFCPEHWPGITPAWAGKSGATDWTTTSRRDHPRMGGEKPGLRGYDGKVVGSPPHGRGKEEVKALLHFNRGITPAWAGKSPASQPWSPPLWMMVIRPRP